MLSERKPPFWSPEHHADRLPLLQARGYVQRKLREWFENEDFIETDPSALQISPGNEAHLHAFRTTLIGNDNIEHPLYLHTSPEFAMKKLLAAGETHIYSFAHVWRNRERGVLHSPEFTMLEWYRANEDYEHAQNDCLNILKLAASAAGTQMLRFRNLECDPFAQAENLSVAKAFQRYANIDLMACITAEGNPDRNGFAAQLTAAKIKYGDQDQWSDMFSYVLTQRVEPKLGIGRPTILNHYPITEAALARPCPEDSRLAERFELYACGVELANGFGELTDATEQRRRFEADMALKQQLYGESYPLDEEFLSALAHMPPATGVAMGFDRLVMLVTGAAHIDDVIWVPAPQL